MHRRVRTVPPAVRAKRAVVPPATRAVLVKPAGADCNLDCTYCFYLEKASLYPETRIHRMSDRVLRSTVRQVMRSGASRCSFGWQGGEPTLCGREFFESAVAYQRLYGRPGQTVANALQTNGLLLDDAFAIFLRDHKFLVGLSIDGPPDVHDAYRQTMGGRPTHEQVAGAVKTLHRHGLVFNTLTVVTKANVGRASDVYRYLRDLGQTRLQFLPCVEMNATTGTPHIYSITAEEYGGFLIDLFDAWAADGWQGVYVRTFNDFLTKFVSGKNPFCVFNPTCGDFAVVEHNGDVYACDVFVEPYWRIGNLMDIPLDELWERPRFEEFRQRKLGLDPTCQACEWLDLCYGGCPKYRIYNGGPEAPDYFCAGYKAFFAHAVPQLRTMAGEIEQAYTRLRRAQLGEPLPTLDQRVAVSR